MSGTLNYAFKKEEQGAAILPLRKRGIEGD